MVGVPGKYKGCNTCRARRVKCGNERPDCRKCLESGRECEGYERQTVFIVGTPQDRGRCSSHPPRNLQSAKTLPSSSTRSSEEPKSYNTPIRSLDNARGSGIALPDGGTSHQLQVIGLHVPLYMVKRMSGENPDGGTTLSLPTYSPLDIQPHFREAPFSLRSQCLVQLNDGTPEHGTSSLTSPGAERVLLFLYEHNASTLSGSTLSSWQASSWSQQGDSVGERGPGAWTDFPAHHFFARVYRPSAVATAMLNRRPTFASDPEWLSIPWQNKPKSQFDELLDIMLQIPALLERLDHLSLSLESSLGMVPGLLEACLLVQARLEQWYNSIYQQVYLSQQVPFWFSSDQPTTEFPFSDAFAFRDGHTALLLLYYWTAQVSLCPCIEFLGHAITTAVPDPFVRHAPDTTSLGCPLLPHHHHHHHHQQQQQQQQSFYSHVNAPPSHLQSVNYTILYGPQKVRTLAVNICRGLDFALQTSTQPDLLAFPAQVVHGFYSGLNAMATMASSSSSATTTTTTSHGAAGDHSNDNVAVVDGALELMWLGRFGSRMAARGQEIAELVKERKWVSLAEY